jgi:uroporphyrinogen-III synthase
LAKLRRIWVTRTAPEAETTASRLRALGLEPVVVPVLEVCAIADAVFDLAGAEALAFTSAAAIAAFAALSNRRDLPVFAVGGTTAARARAAGFTAVISADGDAAALAARIADAEPRPAIVLHPTAREPAADLPALLAAHGVTGRAIVVYETVETDIAAPAAIDAILVHSARGARAIAGRLDRGRAAALDVFAISEAAAAPLKHLPFRRLAIAPAPNEAALLALVSEPAEPPAPGVRLGPAFWAMIAAGFALAFAGLAFAMLAPRLWPAKAPPAAARPLGKPAPHG